MSFDFDHDVFLNDDFLGKDAIYTPAAGAPKSVRVALSLKPEELSLGGDINPQAVAGEAGGKSADFVGVKRGDTLAADGVTYKILKAQPDETGWITLYLGKSYA